MARLMKFDHLYLSLWMHGNPPPVPVDGVTVALAPHGGETPRWARMWGGTDG